MTKSESRIIANQVIELLRDRKGFDWWWLDNDYRVRITVDIARLIRCAATPETEATHPGGT